MNGMTDETPSLDAAYDAGSTADTIGPTIAGVYPIFAAACDAEIDLGILKDNEHWKAAATKAIERHYLDFVLVCECGKRHRLRFGPDER